ncbi:MAG: hypothetical protein HZB61_10790 [Nitrospirae bacterium]|nr:hypothetical protein [Nitrospirota bacterium]
MVYHVAGRLGSGKTLYCVNKIIDTLLYTDKHIYTNIRFVDCWDHLFAKFKTRGALSFLRFFILPFNTMYDYRLWVAVNASARYHYIPDLSEAIKICFELGTAPESSRLFVWDEIHLDLNARMWKTTTQSNIQFFSMSRKLGFDILMTSQLRGAVDRQMRELADVGFEFKNLKHFRPMGIPVFPINAGLLTKRWANKGFESSDSKTVFIGAGLVRYSAEIGQFYDTKQLVSEINNNTPVLWSGQKQSGLCSRCLHYEFRLKYGNFIKEYGPQNKDFDFGLCKRGD